MNIRRFFFGSTTSMYAVPKYLPLTCIKHVLFSITTKVTCIGLALVPECRIERNICKKPTNNTNNDFTICRVNV